VIAIDILEELPELQFGLSDKGVKFFGDTLAVPYTSFSEVLSAHQNMIYGRHGSCL
jgi:hypothetical protein